MQELRKVIQLGVSRNLEVELSTICDAGNVTVRNRFVAAKLYRASGDDKFIASPVGPLASIRLSRRIVSGCETGRAYILTRLTDHTRCARGTQKRQHEKQCRRRH